MDRDQDDTNQNQGQTGQDQGMTEDEKTYGHDIDRGSSDLMEEEDETMRINQDEEE